MGGLFGTQAQASAILTNLSAGTHTIGAIYDGSGDTNYSSVASGNGPNETTFSVMVGTGTGATPTTTSLIIAAAPMILGDQGTFSISVSPNMGNGPVTGTVALWDAVGPRGAPAAITAGMATIQLEWTQGGTTSVYAVYSGDANNAASSSASHTFTVQPGTPQVALTAQGPSGGLSQTSLLASVSANLKQGTLASPTGFVEFWDSVDGGAAQLLTTLQLTPGAAGASVAGTRMRLASGTHSLHVHYRGDNNWQAGNSASAGAPSYALSFAPDPMNFKGGSVGTATIMVTPAGGFTGTVTLSCPAASFALAGYTCSFSPAQVSITDANAQSAILTLMPKATTAAAAQTGFPGATFWAAVGLWWVAQGLGVLAYRKRRSLSLALRSLRFWPSSRPSAGAWARCSALLAASLVIGCGGGGGGGGGGTGGGPVPTTTTIAVQQSGNLWSVSVTVHSTGINPSGTVSLVVDGAATLTNGVSAGPASFMFSPSPMIGIHTLDARYAGDANNQSSDSGVQTEVFAGNTTVVVAGASGSSMETAAVHVSMN